MLEAVNAGRAVRGLPPYTPDEYAAAQAERARRDAEEAPRIAAVYRGELCLRCDQPIPPDAPVAIAEDRTRLYRWRVGRAVPWCLPCYDAARAAATARYEEARAEGRRWWATATDDAIAHDAARAVLWSYDATSGGPRVDRCAGCGRGVVHLPVRRRTWVVCSARCRRRVYRGNVWATATCAECGRTFEPARDDARYCSSPCRQRAYRQRRRSQP